MSEIILHHYPASPYAEKIRAILGFKPLKWKSVTSPAVMPKPVFRRGGAVQHGRAPGVRAMLNPFPKTYAFVDAMAKLGHGSPTVITSAKALEIAKSSTPMNIGYGLATELEGVKLGDSVEVMPVDYAFDPVKGELLTASADEIVVRRSDPRAGVLQVHFPRFGYELRKAG